MRNHNTQRALARRNPKSLALLTVLGAALAVLLLAGCSAGSSQQTASGDESPPPEETSAGTTTNNDTTSAAPETSTPERTTDAVQAGNERQKENRKARVVVRVQGDEGVSFSGTCRVGGREETVEGQTPQRYDYRLREGQTVTCEVRRTGGDGTLALNVRSGGTVFNQESDGDAVLRASLEADVEGSSSTSSTSVNSSSSIQQSGGSSSSSSSSSVSIIRGDSGD